MQIVAVGLSHATAPVARRERLTFVEHDLPAALSRLAASVEESFLLSTCNRTEVYAFAGHADSGGRHLLRFLAEAGGLAEPELAGLTYVRAHDAAVRHLFRVAAGLDSMVLGEDQIVAQLKRALDVARGAGTLGPVLGRLGSAALAAGKRVRSATALGRSRVSVVSVAVRAAAEELGSLAGRPVLVVGAGRTATVAIRQLAGAGARVTVTGRDAERTALLAGSSGAVPAPWAALPSLLHTPDLVLSCTAAPGIVLHAEMLSAALARRGGRGLMCLDLAVPRDVDPAAAALPNLTLRDMDALITVAAANRALRAGEIPDAEAIVEERVERFMEWWRSRQVVPAIVALRSLAESIRDDEIARALARMPELGERERLIVRGLASRVVNKLLHHPVTILRTDPEGANMAQIVQYLFGLVPDAAACPIAAAHPVPAPAGLIPESS
jgi:glutamyl-tRNA reductase